MTLTKICDGIFRIPAVTEGFCYQQEALEKSDFAPVGAVPGAKKSRIARTTTFRIVLHAGGKFSGDIQLPSLRDAIKKALGAVGINLPAVLGELDTRLQSLKSAPPKQGKNADETAEFAKDRAETIDAIETSIRTIMPLAEWLDAA